jgi:O-antigen ligase
MHSGPKNSRFKASWLVPLLLLSLIPDGFPVSIAGRTPTIPPFDLALIVIGTGMLLANVFGEFRFDFSDFAVLSLAGTYVFINGISLAANMRDIGRGVLSLKVMIFGIAMYVITTSVVRSAEDLERILQALVVWAGTIGYLLTSNFLRALGGDFGVDSNSIVKSEIGIGIGRSNYIAALMLPFAPLAVALIIRSRGWMRVLSVVSLVGIVTGLLVTMSTGALSSLGIAVVVCFPLLIKSGLRIRHVLVALVIVGALLLVPAVRDIVTADYDMMTMRADSPDYVRIDLWHTAWNVFVEHPILGVGPGAVYIFNRQYAADVAATHNFVLNNLAEVGITGTLLFCALLTLLLWRTWRVALSGEENAQTRYVGVAILVGFIATILHGMVEPTFPAVHYSAVFWTLMAVIRVLELDSRAPSVLGDLTAVPAN